MFYSGTPYLQRHPYAITIFGFLTSRYPPLDFSRLSTPILTILTKVITQALPTYNVIPNLHALHTLKFWSMSGSILLLRHYQTQPPPIRQHHFPIPLLALPTLRFFPPLYPNWHYYYKRWFSGSTNLHRHPYAKTVFWFPSSHHLLHDFFQPLYLYFNNVNWKFYSGTPSNVAPTPTPPSDSPPRVNHPSFFPSLYAHSNNFN